VLPEPVTVVAMTNLPSGVVTAGVSFSLPLSTFTGSSSDEHAGAHITAASKPKEKIFFISVYYFYYYCSKFYF
jgi:hypothetical protein